MEVLGQALFRVTRDTDYDVSDETDDLRQAVEDEIRRRRFGEVIRLEVAGDLDDHLMERLVGLLNTKPNQVYLIDGLIGLDDLFDVAGVAGHTDIRFKPFSSVTQAALQGPEGETDILAAMREGDILVHHPYDSFTTSVEAFVAGGQRPRRARDQADGVPDERRLAAGPGADRWPRSAASRRSACGWSPGVTARRVDISDILRAGRSWTALRREAGLPTRDGTARESTLLRRVRALAHVDDLDRMRTYNLLLTDAAPSYGDLTDAQRNHARMLFFSLWPDGGGFTSYDAGLDALRAEQALRDELIQVIDYTMDRARHRTLELAGQLHNIPLRVHARYQREEILAGLNYASLQRRPSSFREGVLSSKDTGIDAFFVTLAKSEADYSPTTMYRDYAISPTLFHWESQSTTSVNSATGQRYINHRALGSNILIFAREQKLNELGTSPYLFLGPATYTSHTGDRPIAITWRLDHPMPTDLFQAASVVA